MDLSIAFQHMDPSEAVKAYAEEKSRKLEKYFQGKIHVTWHFSIEKMFHVARCHLVGNNMDFFAEDATEDLYASIDLVIAKMERQLRKHKEIVRDHVHNMGSNKGADRYTSS